MKILRILGTTVTNGRVEDDDREAQSRTTNDENGLQRSLGSYLRSQRRIAL